jgi:hypothetical protein
MATAVSDVVSKEALAFVNYSRMEGLTIVGAREMMMWTNPRG